MQTQDKRLEELEARIKASADCPLWIDAKNNQVRADLIGGRRGQPVTFPSVFEAARWLEKQIDSHPGASGSFIVDRLWDLHPESERLHGVIEEIFGDKVIDFYGLKYSRDEFPGVHVGALKTPGPADINLWMLATPLGYFGTREFKERWQADTMTEEDNKLLLACFALFAWRKEGNEERLWDDFARLFYQVTELQAPKPAENTPAALQDGTRAIYSPAAVN